MRVGYITALTQLCTTYCKRHFAADTQHTPKHMLNALSMLQNADMTLTQVNRALLLGDNIIVTHRLKQVLCRCLVLVEGCWQPKSSNKGLKSMLRIQ